MTQYIDKDALVAEIERRQRKLCVLSQSSEVELRKNAAMQNGVYCNLLSFLDTLEVKEVDLEKEIEEHIKECLDIKFPTTDIELIKKDVAYTARKFFELGFKAQKGE